MWTSVCVCVCVCVGLPTPPVRPQYLPPQKRTSVTPRDTLPAYDHTLPRPPGHTEGSQRHVHWPAQAGLWGLCEDRGEWLVS